MSLNLSHVRLGCTRPFLTLKRPSENNPQQISLFAIIFDPVSFSIHASMLVSGSNSRVKLIFLYDPYSTFSYTGYMSTNFTIELT